MSDILASKIVATSAGKCAIILQVLSFLFLSRNAELSTLSLQVVRPKVVVIRGTCG